MNQIYTRSLISALVVFSSFASTASAATLYYDNNAGSGDSHWETVNNWWSDANHSSVSSALPSSGDSVYIDGSGVLAQLASPLSLADIFVGFFSGGSGIELYNVLGDAILKGHSYNQGNIVGDARFDDLSYNGSNGSVSGNGEFNDHTYNEGTVGGDAMFSSLAYNGSGGTVGGDAALSGHSYNEGKIGGDASFKDISYNGSGGKVGGDAALDDHTYNEGAIAGGASFASASYNGSGGHVGEDASFSDRTYNEGRVDGHALFSGFAYNGSAGTFGSAERTDGSSGTLSGTVVGGIEPAVTSSAEEGSHAAGFTLASSGHRHTASGASIASAAPPRAIVGAVLGTSTESVAHVASVAPESDAFITISSSEVSAFITRFSEIMKSLDALAQSIHIPAAGQGVSRR